MRERIANWWWDQVHERGVFNVLYDVWVLTLAIAFFLGFGLGFLSR